LRYLAAFGPATPNDASTWSGLTRLGEVFDRLRPRLRTFADEQGRELFDLPDAPRPEEDAPAPVRFLYDLDNLLLSHADRTRVLDPARRKLLQPTMNVVRGPILVDGFVEAAWRAETGKKSAVLAVSYAGRPTRKRMAEVEREGYKLLEFLAPEAGHHDVVTVE
jgi:winged helix DNA-binding protein